MSEGHRDIQPVDFVGDREYLRAALSSDGVYLGVTRRIGSQVALSIIRVDLWERRKFRDLCFFEGGSSPVFFWSEESDFIVWQMNHEDEVENIGAVRVCDGNLYFPTMGKGAPKSLVHLCRRSRGRLFFSYWDPLKLAKKFVSWEIEDGRETEFYIGLERISQCYFDDQDRLRLCVVFDAGGRLSYYRCDEDRFVLVQSEPLGSSLIVLGWIDEDILGVLERNRDGASVVIAYDLSLGRKINVSIEDQATIVAVHIDSGSHNVGYYSTGTGQNVPLSEKWRNAFKLIRRIYGEDASAVVVSSSRNSDTVILSLTSPTLPDVTCLVSFADDLSVELREIYSSNETVSSVRADLNTSSKYFVRSADGLLIECYLTKARHTVDTGNIVVLVHGGPKGVQVSARYNPVVHLLSYYGYTVVQPNFRGSGGRGREFEEAINGEWGGRVVDDLVESAEEIRRCDANVRRVFYMGFSFGGYAALAVAAFSDKADGVVAISPPVDLNSLWRHAPSEWRYRRDSLERMIGSPYTPAGKELLRRHSLSQNLESIVCPVLVFQGDRDSRILAKDVQDFVRNLQNRGTTAELVLFEGEGHGFQSIENVGYVFSRTIDFLRQFGSS